MAPIYEAIASLKTSDDKNASAAARIFGADRSALSKRFSGVRGSEAQGDGQRRLLATSNFRVQVCA